MSIEIRNVTHIYMEKTPYEKMALDDVSLTIEEGSFTAIAGHTGSGKSTLMQHINGLLTPDKGMVHIDGIDINKKNKASFTARRSVGLVFQYPEQQLFEETVAKDIAFGPKNFGLSEDEIKERVKDAMGQMRRVAIAGIIALKPKYLVLDEPTAGLDPQLKANLLNKIKKLHSKEKMTIIMVSHNMDDIAKLADKVAVMNHGKLMIYDKPDKVFANRQIIKDAGLLEPEVMQLLQKIKDKGLDVNVNVLNKNDALKEILTALRKRGIRC